MKNVTRLFKTAFIAIALIFISTLTYAHKHDKKVETVVFTVEMDCMGCANKIKKNIPFEKGVKDLKVDLKANKVSITYRTDKTNKAKLKKAIEKLKFKVSENAKSDAHKNCGHSHH